LKAVKIEENFFMKFDVNFQKVKGPARLLTPYLLTH